MLTRLLTAGMCVLLVVGCAKKKDAAPADDGSASAQPPPQQKPQQKPVVLPADGPDKAGDAEEPNWVKDGQTKKGATACSRKSSVKVVTGISKVLVP